MAHLLCYACPKGGYVYEHNDPLASEPAEFIYSAVKDGLDIICQCDYGESRSAGCAAAILEHFERNGFSIFADYRYFLNKLVYNKLLEALKNTEKDRKH